MPAITIIIPAKSGEMQEAINSSTLGIEGTADMILAYAKAKQEQTKKEEK